MGVAEDSGHRLVGHRTFVLMHIVQPEKKLPKGFCLIPPAKNQKNNKTSQNLGNFNVSKPGNVNPNPVELNQKREHRSSRARNLGEDLGHQKFHYNEMPYTNTKLPKNITDS